MIRAEHKETAGRILSKILPWLVVGLAIVCIGIIFSIFFLRNAPTTEDLGEIVTTLDKQEQLIDEAKKALSDEQRARAELEAQIRSLGERPDTTKPVPSSPFIPVPGQKGDKGDTGRNGNDGAPGAQGIQGPQGPQGPMFPVEQAREILREFFNEFCTQNQCTGTDGTDGRGIVRTECNDEGKFVIFYTDDTSQVVEDSRCKNVIIAPPEEEE